MKTVYLDSSDYSIIASDQPVGRELRSALLSAIADNLIEVRFSHVHLFEAAHLQPSSRTQALARAQAIKEISGSRCLRWTPDILDAEIVNFAKGEISCSRSHAYSDAGVWYPDLGAALNSMMRELRSKLKVEIDKTGKPRNERRRLLKRFVVDDKLTADAVTLVRKSYPAFVAEFRDKLPITDEFYDEEMIVQFASGKISLKRLVDELQKGALDVVHLIGWHFDQFEGARELPAALRRFGMRLASDIQKIREPLVRLRELAERGVPIPADVEGKISLGAEGMRSRAIGSAFNRLFEDASTLHKKCPAAITSARGTFPGFDSFMEGLCAHLTLSSAVGEAQRKLRNSDGADLFHMMYLPYVDVFRCDGYASELAKPIGIKHNVRIVPKASELISWLRSGAS
jgi:hypothetical protein